MLVQFDELVVPKFLNDILELRYPYGISFIELKDVMQEWDVDGHYSFWTPADGEEEYWHGIDLDVSLLDRPSYANFVLLHELGHAMQHEFYGPKIDHDIMWNLELQEFLEVDCDEFAFDWCHKVKLFEGLV